MVRQQNVLWTQLKSLQLGQRAIDSILQLANVAGPAVAGEHRTEIGGELRPRDALLISKAGHEQLRQRHNVLRAVAQRRQIQRQDVEAIVEIFAEKPFLHQLDQVFLRRADHPHIDVHFMILANAAEGAVVEKAQQLGLHARRHLANFIQQHRAAVGLLEEALLALQRVAKQLALDRVLGNGAAVERQIGFARPRTGQMAGMGQQIFTGAGVADNQQRRAEHRQLARLLHHVAHFRPHREDLAEGAGVLAGHGLQLASHAHG